MFVLQPIDLLLRRNQLRLEILVLFGQSRDPAPFVKCKSNDDEERSDNDNLRQRLHRESLYIIDKAHGE
jgi:hypothetical protein